MAELPLNDEVFEAHFTALEPMYNKEFLTLVVQYGDDILLSHFVFSLAFSSRKYVTFAYEIFSHIVH